MDPREQARSQWLKSVFSHDDFTLIPLRGDASFRKYFRVTVGHEKFIVMDAPPDKEPLKPFLSVQSILADAHVCVPACVAKNIEQGFLLLTDFGDELLLYSLTPENTQTSYEKAIDIIVQFQQIPHAKIAKLPLFNTAHIHHELSLFQDWFLKKLLALPLTPHENSLLQQTFSFLAEPMLTAPQVLIHRDYHSRNIMRLDTDVLGVIDFQDAMIGPLPYDLVSLLKDCYIKWPQERLTQWIKYYFTQSTLTSGQDDATFVESFELCGLQRHLKVLGIFSRLALRDKKPQFLNDLPLTLDYVLDALSRQPKLQPFYQFMQEKVQPHFFAQQIA